MTRRCGNDQLLNQQISSGLSPRESHPPVKPVSKIIFSLVLLLLAFARTPEVQAQACSLVPHGGSQTMSAAITIESTGAPLTDGVMVPAGTALRLDAIATADGSCSLDGEGCDVEYQRDVNHINVQSDISSTGLNGHYVEGYVFGWDDNHMSKSYQSLDTHSSNSSGPFIQPSFIQARISITFGRLSIPRPVR